MAERSRTGIPYVAPRTRIERTLCEIWQNLLSVDRVGIDDAFLDLGGHSLTAQSFVARVNQTYAIEITSAELFSIGTIREIVELITVRLLAKHGLDNDDTFQPSR